MAKAVSNSPRMCTCYQLQLVTYLSHLAPVIAMGLENLKTPEEQKQASQGESETRSVHVLCMQ